jgi:hypothetical protein
MVPVVCVNRRSTTLQREQLLDVLTLRLAQADTWSSTILCDEFDARFFESLTQSRNCPLLRRQRARLSFKSFYAGE